MLLEPDGFSITVWYQLIIPGFLPGECIMSKITDFTSTKAFKIEI